MEKKVRLYVSGRGHDISVSVVPNSRQSGSIDNQRLLGFRIITNKGL